MFVRLSACLSVRPNWTTGLALDGFSRNMVFKDFLKICRDSWILSKIDEKNGYFTWGLAHFFLEIRNILDKNVSEIKTRFSNVFPRKSCRLWDSVEKYDRAGQATHGNTMLRMRFAGWVTKATHTHTLRIRNTDFHRNNCCTNEPQCYVIRALRVFYKKKFITSGSGDAVHITKPRVLIVRKSTGVN